MGILNFFKKAITETGRTTPVPVKTQEQQKEHDDWKWFWLNQYTNHIRNGVNKALMNKYYDDFIFRERPLDNEYNSKTSNPKYEFDLDNFYSNDYKLKVIHNRGDYYNEIKNEIIRFMDVEGAKYGTLDKVKEYHKSCHIEFVFVDKKLNNTFPELNFKYILY